jgi:hypothetical protein
MTSSDAKVSVAHARHVASAKASEVSCAKASDVTAAKAAHVTSTKATHVTSTKATHVTSAKATHVASATTTTTVSSAAAAGLCVRGNKAAGKQCTCQNHHHSSSHDILRLNGARLSAAGLCQTPACPKEANTSVAIDWR